MKTKGKPSVNKLTKKQQIGAMWPTVIKDTKRHKVEQRRELDEVYKGKQSETG